MAALSLITYSPRQGRYGQGGANTKTAAVLDKTEFTKPHRDHVSAPVSGSIMSSSWMAPRMKLVRRASRDLSVDVQASTTDPFHARINHG